MTSARPPHLRKETSRHGKIVWYVRVDDGPRIRLRESYGTREFWQAYRLAVEGSPAPAPKKRPGSFGWLIEQFKASDAYKSRKPSTRRARGNILDRISEKVGQQPISAITRESIIASRDARKDCPEAANSFVKTLRVLFAWALDDRVASKHVRANPAADVAMVQNDSDGFHTWTEEEVVAFEKRWPVGTKQRLALDILLYTGLRRGDAVRLGRQHVRHGVFSLKTEKTGEVVTAPVLAPLQRSIDATETGDICYLTSSRGTPWVKESFGNWFKDACVAAGVPGSAHGLRKAGASRAAEQGATEAQLNALFGWKQGSRESATYIAKARREVLARNSAKFLLRDQDRNKERRTLQKVRRNAAETATKSDT